MSSKDIITRAYDKLMGAGERALADELVEFSSVPHSRAPKLIAGLALWNPGAEYHIEYRSPQGEMAGEKSSAKSFF